MRTVNVCEYGLSFFVSISIIILILFLPQLILAKNDDPVEVPLVRLIATPEKYDGVFIRTIGFIRLDYEGTVMYPHREDYEYGLVGNGVWMDIAEKELKQEGWVHVMKYCLIEATFDAKTQGLWSGSLKNIKRLEVWSDPTLGVKRGQSLLQGERDQR